MCSLHQVNVNVKFHPAEHILLQQVSEEQSYCKSVAQKLETQLCKLPRHHPLLRDALSDEGL